MQINYNRHKPVEKLKQVRTTKSQIYHNEKIQEWNKKNST